MAGEPEDATQGAEPQTLSSLETAPAHPTMTGETDGATLANDLPTPSPPRAPRATVKNPIHGLVEGVKRGNALHGEDFFLPYYYII